MLDKNFTVNIAVCDDDDYERNRIIELITKGFSKTDYIENIDRFVSGEDFLAADINK